MIIADIKIAHRLTKHSKYSYLHMKRSDDKMFQQLDLLRIITTLPGILLGFTFHEYAHAYMATKFGDPTPKMQGRLTVNPLVHIDIWGLLLIIFAGFGWAKPVVTNPSYYKGNVKQKDLIVSFAGPVMNFIIAFISAAILLLIDKYGILNSVDRNKINIIFMIIEGIIWINCVLFIFNLVPIPPLDGFHVLINILPVKSYGFIYALEKYGQIILLVFIILPFSSTIIGTGAAYIENFILKVLSTVI
ncbi:MAG: site-2 protease family protein [Clostridiales bacterium]|nr:site-2 protease family protein [Clostridiales bacterium]